MDKLTGLYEKALNWYKTLPLCKKIVYFIVIPLLLVLGIIYFVLIGKAEDDVYDQDTKINSTADKYIKQTTDNTISLHKETQKQLEGDLLVKKTEAAQIAKEKVKITEDKNKVIKSINNASSFEEVDAILKGIKK